MRSKFIMNYSAWARLAALILLLYSCAARPPRESGNFKESDLVEIIRVDSTIRLDIRYATTNNFTGLKVYSEARAFLQRPAAEALARVNAELKPMGYGLMVFDGYRPWRITKMFWDITPPEKREFVADPKKGSRHNRGCAVDLTLYELATGKVVEMTSGYDEMTERAYPEYAGGTVRQREMRDLLRNKMEKNGFSVYPVEWWHFDFKGWESYKVENISFSEIPAAPNTFNR